MIEPIEYNVVVQQDVVEERTAGGLIRPDDARDLEQFRQTRGVIVRSSPMAFTFEDWPADAEKPKEGDRIVFSTGAGVEVKEDGEKFRILKDRDILAVLT